MSETFTPPPPPKGCELLRENVFESDPHADTDEIRARRQPTMTRKRHRLVPPENAEKKYTLVLDLDETVVYAREGPLYARAYLRELLRSIKDDFEVIVWTAGEREYAKSILEEINEEHIIKHLIYRHLTWFQSEDYTKDLKQLGRNLDNVIIIENTPDCVRANPQNGIIVEDFEVPFTPPTPPPPPPQQQQQPQPNSQENPPCNTPEAQTTTEEMSGSKTPPKVKPKRQFTDRTLLLLQEVLMDLAKSGKSVPNFLAQCQLLAQQHVAGSDGKSIPIYYLGKRRRRGVSTTPQKDVRLNRDAVPQGEEVTRTPLVRLRKDKTPE